MDQTGWQLSLLICNQDQCAHGIIIKDVSTFLSFSCLPALPGRTVHSQAILFHFGTHIHILALCTCNSNWVWMSLLGTSYKYSSCNLLVSGDRIWVPSPILPKELGALHSAHTCGIFMLHPMPEGVEQLQQLQVYMYIIWGCWQTKAAPGNPLGLYLARELHCRNQAMEQIHPGLSCGQETAII
jgi:hypothetical protein